jgi:hypothetical protein
MMAPIMIMGVKKPAGMRTVVPTVVSIQRISSVANRPPVETRGKVRTAVICDAQTTHAVYRIKEKLHGKLFVSVDPT